MAQRRPSHVLVQLVKDGRVQPESLTKHERKLLVQFLRLESSMSLNKIAEFIRIPVRTVCRYNAELKQNAGLAIRFYQTEDYARRMIGEYEELKERARAQNDGWLEAAIIRDRTVALGKMGIINFKFEAPGDIVLGDKKQLVVNQTQNINRTIAESLSPEQRALLADAIDGLNKGNGGTG